MSSVVHRGVGGGGGGGINNGGSSSGSENKDCENASFSTSNEKSRRAKGRQQQQQRFFFFFSSSSFQQMLSSWRSWIERKTKRNSFSGGSRSSFMVLFLFLAFVSLVLLLIVFLLFPLGKWTISNISRLLFPPPPPPYIPLDFIVAGFPKCGTTTLLKTLSQHAEISMPDQENCQLARPMQRDDHNLAQLQSDLYELQQQQQQESSSSSSSFRLQQPQQQTKRTRLLNKKLVVGIKCPESLKNFKTIHRLSQHSPRTKFIIGLRHPLLYLESLYNYRVLEVHLGIKATNGQVDGEKQKQQSSSSNTMSSSSATSSSSNSAMAKNSDDSAATAMMMMIPTLWDIYKSAEQTQSSWWDVSPMAPKFEVYLAQFAKTNFSIQEMQDWFRPKTLNESQNETTSTTTTTTTSTTTRNSGSELYSMLAMKPNHFQIFLYTLNQLQEEATSSTTSSSTSTVFSSTTFRRDLQKFLNLQHPIAPFGHDNQNQAASVIAKSKNDSSGSSNNTMPSSTGTSQATTTTRSLSSFSLFKVLLGLGGGDGSVDHANNDNVANSEQSRHRQQERLLLLPGMIDICSSEYDALRVQVLYHYRKVTHPWIANQFMTSPDVVTSQSEFVLNTLQEWTADPCTTRRSRSSSISNRQHPR